MAKKAKRKKFPKAAPGSMHAARKPAAGATGPTKSFWEKIPTLPPPKDEFLGWLCAAGVMVISFLMSFHTLIDNDIFWHLKAGQIIFETHQVPRQDLFSFTRAGKEWIDAQWLFQLIIYALYRRFGYAGLIGMFSTLTALTWGLILAIGFRPRKYFILILVGLAALLTVFIRLKPRPEIFSFFYLALELFLIHFARSGRKFGLYLIPPLMLVWVNSEGLWPVGFVVMFAYLLEEIVFVYLPGISRRFAMNPSIHSRQTLIRLALVLAISGALVFINPYGLRGVIFPWTLFQEVSFRESFLGKAINEFRNPFTNLPWIVRSAYISLIVISVLFFGAVLRKKKIYPAALLLWIGFLIISVSALRNVALFALVTAAGIGAILSEEPDQEILSFAGVRDRLSRLRAFGAAGLLLLMVFLGVDLVRSRFFIRNNFIIRFGVGAMETQYPLRACRFLREISPELESADGLKIFDDLGSAGNLIWTGYPDWKVYVDPRLEVYGDKFYEHYAYLFGDPRSFEGEDAKYGFDAVVLSELKKYEDFIRYLYHNPAWAMVYLDGRSVIFLKQPGPAHPDPARAAVVRKYQIDFQKPFVSPLPRGVGGIYLANEKYVLGFLLNYVMGQSALAARELSEAVRLNPTDLNANWFLGHILIEMNRYAEARPYLEFVARENPDFLPGRIELGRAYAMTGEVDRGLGIFRSLLERNPYEITACMDIAKVYELILKSPNASEQWQKCGEIYRMNPPMFKPQEAELSQALKRFEKMR